MNFFCPVKRPVVPGSTEPSPVQKVYVYVRAGPKGVSTKGVSTKGVSTKGVSTNRSHFPYLRAFYTAISKRNFQKSP